MKRIVIFLLIGLTSCNLFLGTKNLGDGYYLDQDQILYTEKSKYDGFGYCIVPPRLVDYKESKIYIVARSMDNLNNSNYWIIKKKEPKVERGFHKADSLYSGYYLYSNVLGPVDSIAFFSIKDSLDIKW